MLFLFFLLLTLGLFICFAILIALVFIVFLLFSASSLYALYARSLKKGGMVFVTSLVGLFCALFTAAGFFVINLIMHYTRFFIAILSGAVIGFITGAVACYLVYHLFKALVLKRQAKDSTYNAEVIDSTN